MPGFGPFVGYQAAAFGILASEFDRNTARVDMNMQWWLMVELYSRREVTFETDRLPAVSALARLFAERAFPDDTYAAGMWLSQLPESLCWRVHHSAGAPHRQCSRLRFAKVAPSWSWASVDGHVLPPLPRESIEHSGTDIWPFPVVIGRGIYVKEADSRNPYGEFEACLLGLTCKLICSTHIRWIDQEMVEWKNSDKHQPTFGAVIDSCCQFDVPDVEEAGKERIYRGFCKLPGIHLLLVRTWRKSLEEYSNDGFTEGIVVRQGENGFFRRIGHWRTLMNTHDSVFDKAIDVEEMVLE